MTTPRAYMTLAILFVLTLLQKMLERNVSGARMASLSPSMSMFLSSI